ncbi:hybrid sensor histidine kinase/response regulator [Roseiterribacter gracilis]|uniref:Sensory/regulatory protein RpfC n=1 Tax=Roseiterribacter gracilis TaxID=2812848 RepID=A0A8S8XBP7_9PROT|nr:hypothetical protein TMPK1_12860 [Rhodospirillales bacterium TMPK1]
MSRSIALRLVGIVLLLAGGLILTAAWRASDASRSSLDARLARHINQVSDLQLALDVELAAMRGLGNLALSSPGGEAPPAYIKRRDTALEMFDELELIVRDGPLKDRAEVVGTFDSIERNVKLLTRRFDARQTDATLRGEWFDALTSEIERAHTLRRAIERSLPPGMDHPIGVAFEIKDALWELGENLGRERGLIAGAIAAKRTIRLEELQRLAEWRGVIKSARSKLALIASELGPETTKAYLALERAAFIGPYDLRRREILAASESLVPYHLDSAGWFDEASLAVNATRHASEVASKETALLIDRQTKHGDDAMLLAFALVLATVILATVGLKIAGLDVAYRLSQLTSVLNKLAAGDHATEVPGQKRRDEIGRIADAAQVFKAHAIELEEARAAASDAAKTKAEFLATMSHEIRTPMNGVLGMLDLVEDTQLTHEQREMLDVATSSARALLSIIDDILDFSKIEAGKLAIDSVVSELEPIVFGVADLLAPRAWAKEIELAVEVDPLLPRAIKIDPARLRQLLNNLVGNAIKFTERGHVALRLNRVGDTLRIEIVDSGIGLDAAQIARLFRPFEQAEAGTTRRYGGTGLGLAICRRIVDMMDGKIGVDSVPGIGSTFWVELPLNEVVPPDTNKVLAGVAVSLDAIAPVLRAGLSAPLRAAGAMIANHDGAIQLFEAASDGGHGPSVLLLPRGMQPEGTDRDRPIAAKPTRPSQLIAAVALAAGRKAPASLSTQADEKAVEALAPRVGARVLVAEDHPSNRVVVRKMLERLGLTAVLAEDGAQALKLIEAGETFDLLLTDCHMPVLDGFGLTRMVRAREARSGLPPMPIVALSASVMQEEQRRCFDSGMDDFLHKPIDPRRLRAMLTKWIGADPHAVAVEEAAAAAVDDLAIFDFSPYADLFEPDEARRIAQDYANTTREQLKALFQAVEAGDLTAAGRSAHAVAGGSLTIGARHLGEVARTIEMALFEGNLGAANAELGQLEPSFAAVEERIAQL